MTKEEQHKLVWAKKQCIGLCNKIVLRQKAELGRKSGVKSLRGEAREGLTDKGCLSKDNEDNEGGSQMMCHAEGIVNRKALQ